jgi:hypothetical protein
MVHVLVIVDKGDCHRLLALSSVLEKKGGEEQERFHTAPNRRSRLWFADPPKKFLE